MKTKKLPITIALLLILFNLAAFSQIQRKKFFISGGVGYSLSTKKMGNEIAAQLSSSLDPEVNVSYVINGAIDYNLNNNISIGAAFSNNSILYNSIHHDKKRTIIQDVEVVKHNFALRSLYSIARSKHIDLYSGIRLGVSIYTIHDYYTGSGTSASTNFDPIDALQEDFSYQLLLGGRLLFTEWLGTYLEVGLGNAPYVVNGGIFVSLIK